MQHKVTVLALLLAGLSQQSLAVECPVDGGGGVDGRIVSIIYPGDGTCYVDTNAVQGGNIFWTRTVDGYDDEYSDSFRVYTPSGAPTAPGSMDFRAYGLEYMVVPVSENVGVNPYIATGTVIARISAPSTDNWNLSIHFAGLPTAATPSALIIPLIDEQNNVIEDVDFEIEFRPATGHPGSDLFVTAHLPSGALQVYSLALDSKVNLRTVKQGNLGSIFPQSFILRVRNY